MVVKTTNFWKPWFDYAKEQITLSLRGTKLAFASDGVGGP